MARSLKTLAAMLDTLRPGEGHPGRMSGCRPRLRLLRPGLGGGPDVPRHRPTGRPHRPAALAVQGSAPAAGVRRGCARAMGRRPGANIGGAAGQGERGGSANGLWVAGGMSTVYVAQLLVHRGVGDGVSVLSVGSLTFSECSCTAVARKGLRTDSGAIPAFIADITPAASQ